MPQNVCQVSEDALSVDRRVDLISESSSANRFIPAPKSHSHITAVFHPNPSNSWITRQSRSTLRRNLSAQNSTLLLGIVDRLHPWRCQKHP